MPMYADAVVIGAGVAGSGIARALASEGWDVVLLDKDRFPRHKACGEFLSPEAHSSLQALGLAEALSGAEHSVITRARLHTERGATLEVPLPGQAWGISRYSLDARLQQAAADKGARLLSSCPVSEVTKTSGGYRIDCELEREPLTLQARVVIGASGRRPLQAKAGFQAASPKRTFVGVKAHYRTKAEPLPIVDLYFFRGGYVGIAPVEDGRLNVAALFGGAAFREFGGGTAALDAALDEAVRTVPVLRERLDGRTAIPGTQAATYPVTVRPEPQAWREYPLVGDAVAVIPPFCGDGMAMALRSAELCAPLASAYLRGELTEAAWRETYAARVAKRFAGPLRWGSRLDRLLSKPVVGSLLLRAGVVAPWLAQRMVRQTRLDGR